MQRAIGSQMEAHCGAIVTASDMSAAGRRMMKQPWKQDLPCWDSWLAAAQGQPEGGWPR